MALAQGERRLSYLTSNLHLSFYQAEKRTQPLGGNWGWGHWRSSRHHLAVRQHSGSRLWRKPCLLDTIIPETQWVGLTSSVENLCLQTLLLFPLNSPYTCFSISPRGQNLNMGCFACYWFGSFCLITLCLWGRIEEIKVGRKETKGKKKRDHSCNSKTSMIRLVPKTSFSTSRSDIPKFLRNLKILELLKTHSSIKIALFWLKLKCTVSLHDALLY